MFILLWIGTATLAAMLHIAYANQEMPQRYNILFILFAWPGLIIIYLIDLLFK